MPFNLSNIVSWITNVRGISTNDPLLGGDGGALNLGLQDLTSRTQWLYNNVYNAVINGVETLATPQTITTGQIGKALLFTGSSSGTITLPSVASVPVGKGFLFVHRAAAGACMNIVGAAGGETITAGGNGAPISQVQLKPLNKFWIVSTGSAWLLLGDDPMENVGKVSAFAMTTIPAGYLLCNGQSVSRNTYRDLFNVIGETFGPGNGTTTFDLPDLGGMFVRGWRDGQAYDSGREFGSYQMQSMRDHRHLTGAFDGNGDNNWRPINTNFTRNETFTGRVIIGEGSEANPATSTNLQNYARATMTTAQELTGTGENRPENVALMYAIKF